ncbi:hypothetical protein CN582_29130, partial [Bacillus wiedmannii]
YAGYRNRLVASKQRRGQTVSINWPLWKEGRMQIDAETEKELERSLGIISMQSATGIRAFYQSLISNQNQVIVAEGKMKQLKTAFMEKLPVSQEEVKPVVSIPVIEKTFVQDKAIQYFKTLLSSVLK